MTPFSSPEEAMRAAGGHTEGGPRAKTNGKASDEQKADEQKRRFPLVAFHAVQLLTTAPYLVRGILPREGLAVVWGPPKCGKTFLVLDLVMHVVLGRAYRGHRVTQGPVVYVACEGERGLGARLAAWRLHHQATLPKDVPFWLLTTRLDLASEWKTLVADIRAQIGTATPAIIVIDTLNRSIAGSESDDRDMGAYIKAADAVREEFKCLVVPIHHCGLDATRPRGHTSLLGAADAQLAVKRAADDAVIATVEYMKDGEAGTSWASRLKSIDLGLDEDGEPLSSCIVEPSDQPTPEAGPKLSAPEAAAFRFLNDLVAVEGVPLPSFGAYPQREPPILGVPERRWKEECISRGGVGSASTDNGRNRAVAKAIRGLLFKQRAAVRDGTVWVP